MIIGKSNHPVEVKRIFMRVWPLRREIEDAIARRHERDGDDADYSDIIKYYTTQSPQVDLEEELLRKKHLSLFKGGQYDQTEGSSDEADASDTAESGENADGESTEGSEESSSESSEENSEENSSEEENSEEASDAEGGDDEEDEDMKAMMEAIGADGDGGEGGDSEAGADGDGAGEDSEAVAQLDPDAAAEVIVQLASFDRSPPEESGHAHTLLSDVFMDEMIFFSSESFIFGQSVSVEFLIPKRFILSGVVDYCSNVNPRSRIIKENATPYRIRVKFHFLHPYERTNLRDFLRSVQPEVPLAKPRRAAASDDDEDDDDDDDLDVNLDDLGI